MIVVGGGGDVVVDVASCRRQSSVNKCKRVDAVDIPVEYATLTTNVAPKS